jgi:ABC-type Fe3+-siderophore transport system permease subunit
MYDKLVHLVGGFLVAFICLSIIYVKRMPNVRISHLLLMGIFASLVIGVGWEIFELQADITSFKEVDYWSNNSSDIVADVVGGLVATWYFAQRFSLSKK